MSGREPGGRADPGQWRRRKILQFIQDFTQREGYPPTLREIAETMGLATSTVFYHLSVLQDSG